MARSVAPQPGQRERGWTRDSPRGRRWITTLRNEPTAAPRKPIRTIDDARVPPLRTGRRDLLGLANDSPGGRHGIEEVRRLSILQAVVVAVILDIAGVAPAEGAHDAAVLLGDRAGD